MAEINTNRTKIATRFSAPVGASWLNDHTNAVTLKTYFGEKKLKEIQPLDIGLLILTEPPENWLHAVV